MKCQDNFKFKVTNYNTLAPKIYTKFIDVTIEFPVTLSETSYICLYHEFRYPHATVNITVGA